MNESATDVIVARARRPEPLVLMVASSAAIHGVAIAAVAILAAAAGRSSSPPPVVMMVNLTGSDGPVTDGTAQIGGLGVPQAKPDPEPPPEPRAEVPPPAPPKMTLPAEKPRPRTEPRKTPDTQARQKETPPAPVSQGNAPIDTGARGAGFGLGSSGGAGNATVLLDTSDFCCNEYLALMHTTIKRNWDQNQANRGVTVMKFTIARDGQLSGIEIEQSSGFAALDRAAQRALALTTLQPLPDRYTNATLTVHIKFEY